MQERVAINVSGTKFEMPKETFVTMTSRKCMAAELLLSQETEQEKGAEYILDRGVFSFHSILGYFLGRGLHLPTSVCTMEFKDEIEFWGIEPTEMSRCCYCKYVSFFDDQSALGLLESDQQKRLAERVDLDAKVAQVGWTAFQAKAWLVLEQPSYSIFAKLYFWISAFFVGISITVLVCGTHSLFTRDLNIAEWKEYFGDDFYKYEHHFNDSKQVTANETAHPLPEEIKVRVTWLGYLEYVTVIYFSVELVARFIVCPYKRRFFCSFFNWVDILSLLAMCVKYVVHEVDPAEKYRDSVYDVIHFFQIVRIFRLFRLVKNDVRFLVMGYTVRSCGVDVLLLSMYTFVAMLFFSSFVFFTGDEKFTSIPDAFWWAIITMTTVGYGDVHPTLPLSKTIGAFTAISGLFLLAVIVPIFVNSFIMFYSYSKVWGGNVDQARSLPRLQEKNDRRKQHDMACSRKIIPENNTQKVNV